MCGDNGLDHELVAAERPLFPAGAGAADRADGLDDQPVDTERAAGQRQPHAQVVVQLMSPGGWLTPVTVAMKPKLAE